MARTEGVRRLTEGRLGGVEPHPAAVEHALQPWLQAELRLFDAHLRVDMAHLLMLARQGIVSGSDARMLLEALHEIREEGAEGLGVDARLGSLLVHIEQSLRERVGEEVAGRLHTARSRNDLSAAVGRLHARDQLLRILAGVAELQEVLLGSAGRYADALMPGYTHLQPAQPTTFGHHLLRHSYAFARDQERVEACYRRTNLSSLGGCAMVGTSWPIDRELVARLLGHEGVVRHATDACAFARDYPPENAATMSILVANVGRLASDLYLWTSAAFGLVALEGSLSGTSSVMPQKKNPVALERILALSGAAIGWLPTVLGALRSPSSSDLGLHFAPDPTPDMADATRGSVELMTAVLRSLEVDREAMQRALLGSWVGASNLADAIVRSTGLSFRDAHQVVGRLVHEAVREGVPPEEVGAAMLDAAAGAMIGRSSLGLSDTEIRESLDAKRQLAALSSSGSANPLEVRAMAEEARQVQAGHREWLSREHERISEGERLMAAEAASLPASAA